MKEAIKRIWQHLIGKGFEHEWKREQLRKIDERFEIDNYYLGLIETFEKNNAFDAYSIERIFGDWNRERRETKKSNE